MQQKEPAERSKWVWSCLGAKVGPNYVQCYEKSKKTSIISMFISYSTWRISFQGKSCGCTKPE